MFVDIDDTSSVCVGDILYFKESSITNPDYWGYAVRIEEIDDEDDDFVTITAPNLDVVKKISSDDWNENPDFDGKDVHKEVGTRISRLALLAGEINSTPELDDFLGSL